MVCKRSCAMSEDKLARKQEAAYKGCAVCLIALIILLIIILVKLC